MYKPTGYNAPHERFVDQFELDGDDWLYRYNNVGPAYRVTDSEKDDFVVAFDRREKWSFWIGLPLLLGLLMIAFFVLPSGTLRGSSAASIFIGPLLGFAWRASSTFMAFRAPVHGLRDRTPVAPRLSNTERRRIELDQISYMDVAGAAFAGILMLVLVASFGLPTRPMERLSLIFFPVLLLWAIIQGTRKWLAARADYAANTLI